MRHAATIAGNVFVISALIVLSIMLMQWGQFNTFAESLIGGNLFMSSVAFVLILAVAIVFAPITVMPLIPMATVFMGPFLVGVLSVMGWTLGSVCAFLIARHAGRPLLARLVSLERIKSYEHLIPERMQFVSVVLLRMLIPVDVLSYALGFTISMPLWKYTLATALGVTWFSFAFAYMGNALFTQNTQLLFGFGIVSLALVLFSWCLVIRSNKKNKKLKEEVL